MWRASDDNNVTILNRLIDLLTFIAADMPVFAFVANRLARHIAKPAVGDSR